MDIIVGFDPELAQFTRLYLRSHAYESICINPSRKIDLRHVNNKEVDIYMTAIRFIGDGRTARCHFFHMPRHPSLRI